MNGYCIWCKRVVDVLVLGDWLPPWALCPECVRDRLPDCEIAAVVVGAGSPRAAEEQGEPE